MNNPIIDTLCADVLLKQSIRYRDALLSIARRKGMCIYGTPSLADASTEEKEAFRLGSNMAYEELADVAIEALGDAYKPPKPVVISDTKIER